MYDVAVAGAGPAGNMAALRMAERGMKVAVVDWRVDVGNKLCTGIVGKECVEHFPVDESLVYHAATGATVVSPGGARYTVRRQEAQAYVLDRAAYIRGFAEQAQAAGAEYMLGPRIHGIDMTGDGVTLTLRNESSTETLRAQALVIASGFGTPLLRMSGLDANKREEYLVGCQALVECGDLERTEVYAGDKVAQGSFGWLVPVGGSMALAGAVSRNNPGPRFKTWLEQLQLSGKVRTVETQTQNWGIPIRPLPKTYGDRVLAVGDSAGLVKPLTGGGIYYALRSGAFAAETLCEAAASGDFSSRGLQEYERRWKDLLAKELRIGYYGRLIYETLDDNQIEKLMAEFLSEDVLSKLLDADDFSFDWHSRVIAKALRIRNLSTMLRSFGPVVSSVLSRMW